MISYHSCIQSWQGSAPSLKIVNWLKYIEHCVSTSFRLIDCVVMNYHESKCELLCPKQILIGRYLCTFSSENCLPSIELFVRMGSR